MNQYFLSLDLTRQIVVNSISSIIQITQLKMMRVKQITQTLKYCLSNQPPKNIPKPAPLQFNFQIPKKAQPQPASSTHQVKITKAKRSADVNKLLKKKKQGEEYKSKIEQEYQQQQQKKVQQNIKTARYLEDQYFKGEQLLQNIPLDPFYSYKLADFQRKLQMQKDKHKDFISNYTDFDFKAETKFKIAEQYHEKQQKYEIEEFLRYMEEYPGSPKGPSFEDDPEFFIQYAYKKMPAVLAIQLGAKAAEREAIKKKKASNNMNEMDIFYLPEEKNFSSILGFIRSFEQPLEKDWNQGDQIHESSKLSIFKEHEQIPEIPELPFTNYQHYMREFFNWKNFKNYYVEKNGEDVIKNEMEYLYKLHEENDQDPENPYFMPRGKTPSLMRYYQTLPKHIQQHPGLKDIYLGLEFHCPYIPYEEKEQLLNLACTKILPLDKLSRRAMSDFIEKKKEYLTPFLVDKIFNINPEFTWDIKDFFAQIKREQLKGQSMIKEGQSSYPEPPQVHLEWEEGVANLPVDFYENEDGFWDEIISEKLQRQDEAKPIMKVRKHFYH